MKLNDISDESEYSIDNRQYYSQSYNITVMAYIIKEDDYIVVERPEMKFVGFEGERKTSGQFVLGPASTADVIPGLGTVLSVLESKWGFLFIIVFPILIASVNQISIVCSNIMKAYKESILEEAKAKIKAEAEGR